VTYALWAAQFLLAAGFLFAGALKLFYDRYSDLVIKAGSTPVGKGLAAFIGIAEIAGAVGAVLPMALHVAPVLTPWAAVGLAAITLLAVGYHLRCHESATGPIVLFLLAGFVAVGRFLYLT
jgi:hypothetical protein